MLKIHKRLILCMTVCCLGEKKGEVDSVVLMYNSQLVSSVVNLVIKWVTKLPNRIQ